MASGFVNWVVDQLQLVGPVVARRMFGGYGLFIDGLMFAIVFDDLLYLKADAQSREAFIERGLGPFTYLRRGKPCSLSYYQVPDEVLESVELMRQWGNQAYGVALRAQR
ncbi:TfoX/Sxy family protein [Marinobacterium sp. YM272]|uniref:TfoX/Sxy family protein n=1 Tax=Marinobacterium sp. YM272 TaxID=3421654 RepID=UPI003D7F9FE5